MNTKLPIEELKDITIVIVVYSSSKAATKVTTMSTVQKRLFDLYELNTYTSQRDLSYYTI
jgi:hypothetical protein